MQSEALESIVSVLIGVNVTDPTVSQYLKDFHAASEYPENLSVGRPRNDRRAPQVAYYIAAAYEALGQLDSAVQAYQESADLLKDAGDRELRPTVMQSLSAVQLRLGRQMDALVTMQSGLEAIEKPSLKQKLIKKILRSPFSYFNRLT